MTAHLMTSAVKVSAAGTRNLALCPNPNVGSADQCLPACGGLPLGAYMVSIMMGCEVCLT